VRQGVVKQIGNVLIRKSIVNVRPDPAPADQALGAQDAESLGHRRELLPHRLHDLRHAQLAARQHLQNAEPRPVAHGAEQRRGPLNGRGAVNRRSLLVVGVVIGLAPWGRFLDGAPPDSLFQHLMK